MSSMSAGVMRLMGIVCFRFNGREVASSNFDRCSRRRPLANAAFFRILGSRVHRCLLATTDQVPEVLHPQLFCVGRTGAPRGDRRRERTRSWVDGSDTHPRGRLRRLCRRMRRARQPSNRPNQGAAARQHGTQRQRDRGDAAAASGGGSIPRLYRGVLAASLRPQALCMYTGNEWCKRLVAGPSGELTISGAFLAGGLTGYVESASVTPFEVVKVRMQSLDHVGKYTSSLQCVSTMLREEGVASLYNGFWASCWRNCTINGMLFGVIYWTRNSEHITLPQPSSAIGTIALDLAVGMWAAGVSTIVKMPFDVAKSRIQNQPTPLFRATRQSTGIRCSAARPSGRRRASWRCLKASARR